MLIEDGLVGLVVGRIINMGRIVAIGANLKDWQKKGKRKKTSRKILKKQLDKLWAEVVKQRANNICEYKDCKKTTYLNSHHIFSRSNLSVRWDIKNGVCLCSGHHTLTNDSAHKNPVEFVEWLKQKRGEKWYNELRLKANQVKKWTNEELESLLEELKEIKK